MMEQLLVKEKLDDSILDKSPDQELIDYEQVTTSLVQHDRTIRYLVESDQTDELQVLERERLRLDRRVRIQEYAWLQLIMRRHHGPELQLNHLTLPGDLDQLMLQQALRPATPDSAPETRSTQCP